MARGEPLTSTEGFRWITWEIGTAELQRSAMAIETFEVLRDRGSLSAPAIRDIIRRRRKLLVSTVVTGNWKSSPSERFVNEHAWVLSKMDNPYRIAECIDKVGQIYRLLPDGTERMPALLAECRRREPFRWQPEC